MADILTPANYQFANGDEGVDIRTKLNLEATDVSAAVNNVLVRIADLTDSSTIDFSATVGGSPVTAIVKDSSITFAKMQAITDGVLLGASGGTTVEEITVSTGLNLSGNVLTATGSYNDEMAQDAVGGILTDTATIDFTYNDAAPSITADVKDGSITFAKMQAITDQRLLGAQGGTTVEEISIGTGLLLSSNTLSTTITQYTDEMAQDAVGAMVDTTLVYVDATPLLTRAALTGDVTASQGSNATTIANDAVTFAKMQNIATDSLIGRDTTGTGDPENILLNATLSMDGAGNLQRAALTGDVTASAGSNATTIANNAVTTVKILDANVTYAKIANGTGLSVIGRSTNSAGVNADIVGTDGQVLRVSGTTLGFGTIVAAGIASDAVTTVKVLDANITYAKIQNVAGLSVFGRSANTSGVGADITAGTDGNILRRSGTTIGFGSIDLTAAGTVGTSILPVANGGSGVATRTIHALQVGNGTSAVTQLTVGTNGQLLIGQTGVDPAFTTVSGAFTITAGGVATGKQHTRQVFLTGTAATYTTPAGCTQIVVRAKGAGGGGGGSGVSGTVTGGGNGGDTIFNSVNAGGGKSDTGTGAAGGSSATGTATNRIQGAPGSNPGCIFTSGTNAAALGGAGGGQGGGKAQPTLSVAGTAGAANTGGGGSTGNTSSQSFATVGTFLFLCGGGEGEYIEIVINGPSATYTYTVGTGGTAGGAGTNGQNGAAGGSGYIIVDEYY